MKQIEPMFWADDQIKKRYRTRKKTAWFDKKIKPQRDGWYQVWYERGKMVGARYFFKGKWYTRMVEHHEILTLSFSQQWKWRGLSEQPKGEA